MKKMSEGRAPLEPARLKVLPHDLFANQWLVLASGNFAEGRFNCMTVAWGSIGTMWNKPFVQVVVRPQRHTFTFMERYPTFTLSAFPRACRPALQVLGTQSGRDGDKLSESGLTPAASRVVAAPSFAEAELSIECVKMYWQDFDPKGFVAPHLERNYPDADYHRAYYGEIVAVDATQAYAG